MRAPLAVVILVASLAACSDSPSPEVAVSSSTAAPASSGPTTTAPTDAVLTESLFCDPLDERACLLPWPNDAFTAPDPSTVTGRRLSIRSDSPPQNVDGAPIDVSDINRSDGFSPNSAVLAFVPDLDVEASGIAPVTDIGSSLDDDAPVALLDTATGERIAYWGELDAQAPAGEQVLIIRPAVSLPEGHRVVVALRNLVDTSGASIPPTAAFRAALDNTPEPLERARAMRAVFADLQAAGIDPADLYLAWDFTVASAESLSGRLLTMRSMAYAELGDGVPRFEVTSASDDSGVRSIEGTFRVPSFLDGDGGPGSRLLLGDDGLPRRNDIQPFIDARFRCVVGTSGALPTIVYGHGLLGDRNEVAGLAIAVQVGVANVCATDWIGMSSDDIGAVIEAMNDLSSFGALPDRLQHAHIAMQYLGRLVNHPQGLAADPAFNGAAGTVLQPDGALFIGNSQGGILGGAASAISTEWQRVVLGVPGINYSLLLTRSSDWPQFQTVFDAAYTDPVDRVLALQLVQTLWDRGENGGYAQHLTTDPYDGIAAKDVLLVEAFGDHQVANVSTEVLARTIGAVVQDDPVGPGRSLDVDPLWGIERVPPDELNGVVLALWDFGTSPPPTVNLPPSSPAYGEDPHGAGASEPLVLQQAFTFLATGTVPNVCPGPCVSSVLTD